jgi:RimJ/RimL family protein N-acetyltransferase
LWGTDSTRSTGISPEKPSHTWTMPRLVDAVVQPGALSGTDQPDLPVDERLLLRPWNEEDIPAVVNAYAEQDIQAWNLNSMDDAEAHEWIRSWSAAWEAETDACWAVAEQSDQSVVGRVALRRISLAAGSAEVTYWVAPHARRRGAATLATMAAYEWAFESLGLHRVELIHSVHNEPSCGVATGAGFALEGTLKSALLHADGWHDMHLHALINPAGA